MSLHAKETSSVAAADEASFRLEAQTLVHRRLNRRNKPEITAEQLSKLRSAWDKSMAAIQLRDQAVSVGTKPEELRKFDIAVKNTALLQDDFNTLYDANENGLFSIRDLNHLQAAVSKRARRANRGW